MTNHPTNKSLNSGELWNNHAHEIDRKNRKQKGEFTPQRCEFENLNSAHVVSWQDVEVIQLWLCCLKLLMSWWSELKLESSWMWKDNLISRNILQIKNHSEFCPQIQWKAKYQMPSLWWMASLVLNISKVAFRFFGSNSFNSGSFPHK